jgi:predicted thioesterase
MELSPRQRRTAVRTLSAALESAARRGAWPPGEAERPDGHDGPGLPPSPYAPPVGVTGTMTFTVAESDTAAAMGHPDPAVTVLGSPRISLWFEKASGTVMPPPSGAVRHLGVAIFVHHLAAAHLGETVDVDVEVVAVEGRRVILDCEARVGDRLVAFGTHHRILRLLEAAD